MATPNRPFLDWGDGNAYKTWKPYTGPMPRPLARDYLACWIARRVGGNMQEDVFNQWRAWYKEACLSGFLTQTLRPTRC